MQTSEVLNKAADLIEERGWWNGYPETALGGTKCPMLAINDVAGVSRLYFDRACGALENYIQHPSIPMWNDAPGRTASEVIEVLRACAVIEASREREAAEASA